MISCLYCILIGYFKLQYFLFIVLLLQKKVILIKLELKSINLPANICLYMCHLSV